MAAGIRIVWLGHATVLVELDGVRVLTDPVLRRRVTHLRRLAPPVAEPLDGVDAVVVSHVHFDHLDLASLELLDPDVRVVVPRGAGSLLTRRGLVDVVEVDEGDEIAVRDVRLRATHADHDANRGPLGVRAASLGYVLEGTGSVYFAGDTGPFDGMASLAPALDVALLPVAGWGSRLPPGHLDPVAAADTLVLLRPRVAIPIHWATFAPLYRRTTHDPDAGHAFAARAHAVAPEVDVRVLRVGESSTVELAGAAGRVPAAGAREP